MVTYIGAEYCPFCAAERWALTVALSRFGTFSGLAGTHSSSTDVYPDTQTLSFYGSHYTSPYLDFQPVEETTNQPVGGGTPPCRSLRRRKTSVVLALRRRPLCERAREHPSSTSGTAT